MQEMRAIHPLRNQTGLSGPSVYEVKTSWIAMLCESMDELGAPLFVPPGAMNCVATDFFLPNLEQVEYEKIFGKRVPETYCIGSVIMI